MGGAQASAGADPKPASLSEIQARLRKLDQRDWFLWATAIVILLLLCGALFLLSFPSIWKGEELLQQERLQIGIRGLLGLVLLFSASALYQQYTIKTRRSELAHQIGVVADQQGRNEVYERLAILDPATGLFNRKFAAQHLAAELSRADAHGYSVTVLMLDIHDFAAINERYGRSTGDAVLTEVARHIKKAIRSSDLPVRMGNDDFLVVLPGCSADEVQIALKRMQGCEVEAGGKRIAVEFNAGVAAHREGDRAAELLQRADDDLYRAKMARAAAK